MYAAIAQAINAARPVVVAAAPYVVRAAKVSAVIGAINFGTRMTLRGGANYLRRKANEEGLDNIYADSQTKPHMTGEDYSRWAAEMPGFRGTSLKEKFAFLWDVTWTSSFTMVSNFYATLTLPIWFGAWLLRATGNVSVWVGLRFLRLFGIAPWTERSYNDRTRQATWTFYQTMRKPTLGLAERLNIPFVRGTLYEIQRAFFPHLMPDFYVFQEQFEKTQWEKKQEERAARTSKTGRTGSHAFTPPAPPTTEARENVEVVFDSEAIKQQDLRSDAGLARLFMAFEQLVNMKEMPEDELEKDPEHAAKVMRQHIINTKRSAVHNAEESLPKFFYWKHLDGYTAERFAAEFLQQGIHIQTDDSTRV